jgi:hypothetical protein
MFIKLAEFLYFYDKALRADHTFHKVRQELWNLFMLSYTSFNLPGVMPLPPSTFLQIKTYLCSRNDMTNPDDKRLAFEVAIQAIFERILSVSDVATPVVHKTLTLPRGPDINLTPLTIEGGEESDEEEDLTSSAPNRNVSTPSLTSEGVLTRRARSLSRESTGKTVAPSKIPRPKTNDSKMEQ